MVRVRKKNETRRKGKRTKIGNWKYESTRKNWIKIISLVMTTTMIIIN